MNKHKWHKEIKAWADGFDIEQRYPNEEEIKLAKEWFFTDYPDWEDVDCEFRIKPHRHKREIYWNETEEKYCSRRICGCGKYDEIIPNQTTIDAINEAIQSFECEALKQDIDTFRKINQDLINKEWQGLDLEKQRALYHQIMAETNVNVSWWDFKIMYPFIEQKLKEKNHGTT